MDFKNVFTPNDQPTITYISRENAKTEQKLKDYIDAKNMVVSICGPSKTGKTVLLRNSVNKENLIPINGASIRSIDDFYSCLFSFIDMPEEKTVTDSSQTTTSGTAGLGFNVGFGGLAALNAKSSGSVTDQKQQTISQKTASNPITIIISILANTKYIIFIDDFHYIEKNIQSDVAKVIKSLAENGVKICTASVPHRNDDVVRANAELRGRLATIDIPEWNADELKAIATKGFVALNAEIDPLVINNLVEESFQSPQLMQALCMNLCRIVNLRKSLDKMQKVSTNSEALLEAKKDTSDFANFSSLVDALHSGPKIHGMERKQFDLTDGTQGDVYRAILLAMKSDPPSRHFSYDQIIQRVKDVCIKDTPTGSSISGSLSHISDIAKDMAGGGKVLEWDDNILTIIDPYFSFYLRSSDKLIKISSIK